MFNLESAVQPVVGNVDRGAVKFSRVEFDGSLQNLPKLLRRIARSGGAEGGRAATRPPLNEPARGLTAAATRACGSGINHATRATLHMIM